MSGLLEDLTKDFPADPARAICQFADRVIDLGTHKTFSSDECLVIVTFIRKFAEKFSIAINLSTLDTMKLTGSGWQQLQFREAIKAVKLLQEKLKADQISANVDESIFQYAATLEKETFGVAFLNSDEKQKIQIHLNRIRKIIEESPISDRKKNALFDRLNELSREVDAHVHPHRSVFCVRWRCGLCNWRYGKESEANV